MKGSGASISFASSVSLIRWPFAEYCEMQIIALMPYSQLLENIPIDAKISLFLKIRPFYPFCRRNEGIPQLLVTSNKHTNANTLPRNAVPRPSARVGVPYLAQRRPRSVSDRRDNTKPYFK